jgi:hypothetical protein
MTTMHSLCRASALAMAVLSTSAEASFVTTASSLFQITSPSPASTPYQVDGNAVDPGTIIPGGSGAGSGLNQSFSDGVGSYGAAVSVVQDYGVFHGTVTLSASQVGPGNSFRSYAAAGSGTFTETLAIAAPSGVANGSIGTLTPGWDISGSLSACCDTPNGESARAALFISAQTSAPLPNTYSVVRPFTGNGHYDLADPLQFIFGTPFQLTVTSLVRADIAYDFRTTTPTASYNGVAAASFLDTAALTTALVTDAAGTPLSGVSIVTSSGRAFPVAAVPLPSALWMLGAALGGIGLFRSKRD